MHIRRIELENIRSIKHLVWELPEGQDGAGWHVILGDNGSGKTSFARSIALTLVGPTDAHALRLDFRKWTTINYKKSKAILSIDREDTEKNPIDIGVEISNGFIENNFNEINKSVDGVYFWMNSHSQKAFSASFGPFRRFSGGPSPLDVLPDPNNILLRHLTLFDEGVSLPTSVKWLQFLKFRSLEADDNSKLLLQKIINFINKTNFLPNGYLIQDVNSENIRISNESGITIDIDDISDGYRSALCMILEIIRIADQYGTISIFNNDVSEIDIRGVIIIDEIDAHLHPKWQKEIGMWFKKYMPYMQFIVTTHSPLICWAADSVFVLPEPGSRNESRFLTKEELNRVKYGSIQEAYMLDVFGEIDRSDEGREKLKRLSELNNKEWDGEQMTQEEQTELRTLRSSLPLSSLYMKN
jgi:predicted ATP-dependent endonuclease of OLD family